VFWTHVLHFTTIAIAKAFSTTFSAETTTFVVNTYGLALTFFTEVPWYFVFAFFIDSFCYFTFKFPTFIAIAFNFQVTTYTTTIAFYTYVFQAFMQTVFVGRAYPTYFSLTSVIA